MAALNLNWGFKFSRLNPEALDQSGFKDTKAEAEAYLTSGISYDSQLIYVKEEQKFYKIIEESGNLVLKGLVTAEDTPEIDGGEF